MRVGSVTLVAQPEPFDGCWIVGSVLQPNQWISPILTRFGVPPVHQVATVEPSIVSSRLGNFIANTIEAVILQSPPKRKSKNLKEESGGPYRTRTYNQLIKSQLLYQLS